MQFWLMLRLTVKIDKSLWTTNYISIMSVQSTESQVSDSNLKGQLMPKSSTASERLHTLSIHQLL